MRVEETSLQGLKVIEPVTHRDARGFVRERFSRRRYAEAGITVEFVQDNHASSRAGALRGLHYQLRAPQAKLVEATVGEVWDVAVDLRRGSDTFGQWFGTTLDAASGQQLFVPGGFAHGFCVLSDVAEVQYKLSAYYDPEDQHGIRWDDPRLAIDWPCEAPILSDRDAVLPCWRELAEGDFFP